MKKIITLIIIFMLLTACGSSQVSIKNELSSDSSKSMTKLESIEESQVSLSDSLSTPVDNSTQYESSIDKTSEFVSDTKKEIGILGIAFFEVPSDDNEAYGTPMGLYIESILQGGAADQSDLLEGDIITAFDGQTIRNNDDLSKCMANHYAGDKIRMTVQRRTEENSYEEKKIDVVLVKESDVPSFSSHKANLPEEFNFESCAAFCESHMPDGITASFTQVEHNGIPIVIGQFHNDTENDLSLEIEYEYGDDKGNFSTTGWGGQPLLRSGEDYYEVLDSEEEYQSFIVRCRTTDVTEEIYNRYASIDIQHHKNADGAIEYTTTCTNPNECFHGIKVLYLNENNEIIDYSIVYENISDTEDEPLTDTLEKPSKEYDSYIFIWECEDI